MPDPAEVDIDFKQLIKPLGPDVPAQFEPMSGLMLLNMDFEEYQAAFGRYATNTTTPDDITFIGFLNHETYHAVQVAASGYVFDRQRRLFQVLNAFEPQPEPDLEPDVAAALASLHALADGDAALGRRADHFEAVIRLNLAVAVLNERAAPNDHSLFGAMHPEFFREVAAVTEHESAENADGLSIIGIIEGSATAFAHQLMHPQTGAVEAMESQLSELTPIYRQLWTWTKQHVGERAIELILPASALALFYAEPHNAYGALLSALEASPPGGALAAGRILAAALPAIPAAGAILGTSIPIRRRDDSFRIYDTFIDNLEAARWGVDAYAALADPNAMNRVQSFPFAAVTSDNAIPGPGITAAELLARLSVMSIVLRTQGRRMDELNAQDLVVGLFHEALSSMDLSSPPSRGV